MWFLLLCVLLGVFAPSRADAHMAETRTWVFAPEVAETRLETEPQAVGTHQENGLWNYEHAPGCTQAAESAVQPRNALGQFMSKAPGQRPPGFNAVDDFVTQAQKNGYEVVEREVSFNTPFGQRRYDAVLRDPVTGRTSGIEIKSSAGAMNRGDAAARQQFAADRWINESGGATSVGGKGGITIESTYKIQW
jgi:hypothetical protein